MKNECKCATPELCNDFNQCDAKSLEKQLRKTNTKFSNGLSDAETERLAILAEECAEVIQIVGKILRHGYIGKNPNKTEQTNRDHLETELGDVYWIVDIMLRNKDINQDKIDNKIIIKDHKSKKYLHHQG